MSIELQSSGQGGHPPSLGEWAYEAIRDRLIMLDIRPGEPLSDDALAQDLGTGRTPVREALKQLESDRLVVAYPRPGTFATTVDITDLAFISEIRTELEPLAAARAARTATAETRIRLGELAKGVAEFKTEVMDRRELIQADVLVHREIYRASGNPYLADILIRQDNLATRIWCLFFDQLPDLAGHVGERSKLLEAIAQGTTDKAAQLALEHVTNFDAAIRAIA
jgi:DNA-binding GntR family transcriptional regulator